MSKQASKMSENGGSALETELNKPQIKYSQNVVPEYGNPDVTQSKIEVSNAISNSATIQKCKGHDNSRLNLLTHVPEIKLQIGERQFKLLLFIRQRAFGERLREREREMVGGA